MVTIYTLKQWKREPAEVVDEATLAITAPAVLTTGITALVVAILCSMTQMFNKDSCCRS